MWSRGCRAVRSGGVERTARCSRRWRRRMGRASAAAAMQETDHYARAQVMHAFCAALRACLKEHTVGLAQLQQQQRGRGLRLQQLWYFMQPAARTMATLHSLLQEVIAGPPSSGSSSGGAAAAAAQPQVHPRADVPPTAGFRPPADLTGCCHGRPLAHGCLRAAGVPRRRTAPPPTRPLAEDGL